MPRRKPRHLDAVRFEMGTKERELAETYIWSQAVAKGGGFLALGAGIAIAGLFMYNTFEDISKWLAEGWRTGFGLVEDAAATSLQVSNAITPEHTNLSMDELPEGYPKMDFAGMSIYTIYELGTEKRKTILDYSMRAVAASRGLEYTGAVDYALKQEFKDKLFSKTYPLCLQNPVIGASGEENSMSEYGYQITIREISSRNDWARGIAQVQGFLSTGIGYFAAGWTQDLLRASGFMQNEAWDGEDWTKAPGAVFDPLLMFAWARTNFETGNWWSSPDSPGGATFTFDPGDYGDDIFLHVVPGAPTRKGKWDDSGIGGQVDRWSYEEVIWAAEFEIQEYVGTENPCPFLNYILAPLGLSVASVQGPESPPPVDGDTSETPEEMAQRIYEEALEQAGIEEEEEEEKNEDESHFGNPFYRTEEEQEEWQRELDRLIAEEEAAAEAAERTDPGYGEGADDNGETEEERRAREDEESGPPRV